MLIEGEKVEFHIAFDRSLGVYDLTRTRPAYTRIIACAVLPRILSGFYVTKSKIITTVQSFFIR